MAENMNGLGSKTKYEYPMAKARDEVKSMFDFVGYTDPTPEYQKSPQLSAASFDIDSILPPISFVLEKFNSKLGVIPSGQDLPAKYAKPTYSAQPLTTSDASPLLSGTWCVF